MIIKLESVYFIFLLNCIVIRGISKIFSIMVRMISGFFWFVFMVVEVG